MHVKRFQPNKFLGSQRNPTIVTFHPRGLDMRPFVERPAEAESAGEGEPLLYDLVANITYEGVKVRDDSVEGEAERKVWKAQVREGGGATNEPRDGGHAGPQWWEMQDLFVDRTNGELLSTKESYIMVWERRRKGSGKGGGGKSG
ncbi:hypothetical protein KC352_g20126 [Hortaea werneckii]|nr:hypothetical protein KC352_g20126 [Hortaea werneckii]